MVGILSPKPRLWAVDKLFLAYLAGTGALLAARWYQLPQAPQLLCVHVVAALAIIFLSRRTGRAVWFIREWYPLPLIAFSYMEMATLIPAAHAAIADTWLARLDFSIWHVNPTVWLERIQTPMLTDFLQIAYTLFIPIVLLVPLLLWRKRRFADFQYSAFLLSLGFLACYVGYILVPASGPRFFLAHLQHFPLHGGWVVSVLRTRLDLLESTHYDCFPSGHGALTILAWWCSRRFSKRLSLAYLAYTICIIFATVYLRYHYTVDLVAGALLASLLIAAGPRIYRKLSGSEDSIGARDRNGR